MDSEMSVRHKVDLERMLLDSLAEPAYLSLTLLEDITNYFSDDQQIGSGGFAVVYKGMIGKGMVAVKKLSKTFGMHENKFHKEVECLMKVNHKNIVRFLGYCSDTQARTANYEGKFVMAELRNWLLCFEYVPNGSLDKYITDVSHGLEWRELFEIIKGTCEGLLHLHEKRILHLDLKPGNILVDDHMIPKIADFGLSRCLDKEQTRASTSYPCGSMGYLAPESFGGKFTFASDIYSLGVIIVEILTGEKGYPEDDDVVDNWMNRLEPSGQWETQLEQVRVCTKIGIQCMDLDPKKRPVARYIMDMLDKTASTIETGITSSSIEQHVNFLNEPFCKDKNSKLSSEYLGKDIKEHAEMKELAEYVGSGTTREDHWQQGQDEAPDDQCSLWEAQGASIVDSNAGVFHKLKNLDIFDRKARKNYWRFGGPSIEHMRQVKLFKKKEIEPILKDKNLIKKDCFGELYMGLVRNVPVTVRKLNSGSVLEGNEFAEEINMLCKSSFHQHIIRLIGCCLEFEFPMLVYDFVSSVSLHDILHSKIKMPLNLGVRLYMAQTTADAISYLHSENSHATFKPKIIHGDVKPAAIFLDNNFVTNIIDVGVSRLIGRDCEHSGPTVGDMDYRDPVYLETGMLTEKSDVYSFGVLMLELLTRKKATHADNNSLIRNFLEYVEMGRKATELFDKEISVAGDLEILDRLAGIAVKCLNHDVDLRPKMEDVAGYLAYLFSCQKDKSLTI